MDKSFETPAARPASASHHDDQDLDPAVFLKSIRELSERREREDLERYRKLEEEVERSRAKRKAAGASGVDTASFAGGSEQQTRRYAERTPSSSPPKADATRPISSARSARAPSIDPTSDLPLSQSFNATMESGRAGPPSPTKDIPEFKGFSSVRRANGPTSSSPVQTSETSSRPSPSASTLARSGTLSWQQRRPQSRGGSRPTSMVSSEDSGHVRKQSIDQPEPSKEQIAASLGSRDPSWFKQTADRGTGSAAYRKSKDEVSGESSTAPPFASARRGLPGLSREVSTEPMRRASPAPSESIRSETASLSSSARDSGIASSGVSAIPSIASKPDLKSLLAEDEPQQQASPMSDQASSTSGEQRSGLTRNLSMSSSQARLAGATERPSSPTKGMGGFVQSAMMKRSDSVSKRWSAQPGAGLSRHNSTLQGSHSMPRLDPTPGSREASNEPASRPTSSSSNLTALAQQRDSNDGFVKPALPYHSRSKSVASTYGTTNEDNATSPPSSPSKRFSPTKSSWIESALVRPDSPKPSAARNSQPSWMANIAKAKAERASGESTPRTGTPKPAEELSRPSSPVKTTPFGPSLLRSSSSRDLAPTPRSSTPPFMKTPKTTGSETSLIREPSPARSIKTSEVGAAPTPAAEKSVVEQKVDDTKPKVADLATASTVASSRSVTSAATAVKPTLDLPATRSITSPSPLASPKARPETPAKPQTDFRSALRSRPAGETKQQGTPEFLSKFGQLRKTQPEKYVAPDLLKDNITRGKSDLAKTGGPVKTPRRDELKESLLAKKQDWKTAKEEGRELPGQVHERKTSGVPVTPPKPEALAKRELLGRPDVDRSAISPAKHEDATPEALARQRSLKHEPKAVPTPAKQPVAQTAPEAARFESLSKQQSAPAVIEHAQTPETSRLAARFNPALTNILARGPPAASASNPPSRSASPAMPQRSATLPMDASGEPSVEGPLQDMRKGRAKGPKKRKGGAVAAPDEESTTSQEEPVATPSQSVSKQNIIDEAPISIPSFKPRAPPGSAASIMMASLKQTSTPPPAEKALPHPTTPAKDSSTLEGREPAKPATSTKPLGFAFKPARTTQRDASPATQAKSADLALRPARSTDTIEVPNFSGFKSLGRTGTKPSAEENKENSDEILPSVKSAASFWGRQPSPKKAEAPPQIQLPSRRDEDAAMLSAGLLSSSHSRPGSSNGSSNGLGISVEKRGSSSTDTPPGSAGLPPKPSKPSRVVSGQLLESSPNKDASRLSPSPQPSTRAEHLLTRAFGAVPTSEAPLAIDVQKTLSEVQTYHADGNKTLRRNTHEVSMDGSTVVLPQQEEYTIFDESVYLFSHAYINSGGAKKTQVFVWSGSASSQTALSSAQIAAKRLARDGGSLPIISVTQGHEDGVFLEAIGGILVTRRGARVGAPKQYALCGRKHLGHITFDEVDFGLQSLCAGYVYLISYPVTLQQTRLYLWKGSACSTEELSAARLAAMDLSETGEIIEVDQGAEFASFLKIFGPGTTKTSISKPSSFWQHKATAPERFAARLYRIQEAERPGLFASLLSRRPSWNSRPPSRSPSRDGTEIKVDAKHITSFIQTDLEAEGLYLLDAYSELYILIAPLFAMTAETVRTTLLAQALRLAAEYTAICMEADGRQVVPKSYVVFSGVPQNVKNLFRHWDDARGLWGTAGLMAGSRGQDGNEVSMVELEEVLKAVCK
ncbi:hypothetical protein LTR97_000766 [Elasticomyces elasticus]|uniref:DUF4045 domain-containing protein n=1 Tax=Elasticomyces elasticus TaxID=574655 RepID=A0AAN7WRC7_9PEZI|nr:hypothetical protein LTR97_000766 [Elasticomyces elasticus]